MSTNPYKTSNKKANKSSGLISEVNKLLTINLVSLAVVVFKVK